MAQILGQRLDVTFTWDDGGVTAPVQMWVEEILMALPSDVQAKVLDEVISRVEYMNEEIIKAEAEIAEDYDTTVGDGIEDDETE